VNFSKSLKPAQWIPQTIRKPNFRTARNFSAATICEFRAHLHADHVGWNTRLENGRWVPTFPNARYLFGRTEFQRWDMRSPDYDGPSHNDFVFSDSILPIAEAGQMVLIDDGHTVDDMLVVEPAPGHTPGHVRIRIRSRGREGIFSGDIIHHPVQVPFPQLCSMFDDDQQSALQMRLKLLGECADRDILLMPTHFAEPHCCRIVGRGASLESNGFERSTISTRRRGYVLAPSPARASCARPSTAAAWKACSRSARATWSAS